MLMRDSLSALDAAAHTQSRHRFAQTNGIWLRCPSPMTRSTSALMYSSRDAGMQLDVLTYAKLAVIPFWRYDLIVLEQARNQPVPSILRAVKHARRLSQAPLVVLTRSMAPEVTVAGLRAGADAVSSVLASEQLLLAHWSAMLKRWKAA